MGTAFAGPRKLALRPGSFDVHQTADMGRPDRAEVARRLQALPVDGEQKARIFLALLGRQFGVRPEGWREADGD